MSASQNTNPSSSLGAELPVEASEGQWPIKRLMTVFFLLTAAGLTWLLMRNGDANFLEVGLLQIVSRPGLLLLLVVLLLLEWYSDYLRYYVLARYLGVSMPFRFGIKIVFANLFFSYLTPGATFGAPVTIYMMKKNGAKLPNAIALAVIKSFLLFFVMLAGGVVVFLFGDFALSLSTQRLLWVCAGFISLLLVLLLVIIFRPKVASRWNAFLFEKMRAFALHRNHPVDRLQRMEQGFNTTLQAFATFGASGFWAIFLAIFTTCLNLFFVFAISVTLLFALGFEISSSQAWYYSFLYYFLIAFAPTPGASGLAEGGGYLFFQHLGPMSLVSSYVVLWRLLTCYLVIAIGAFLFLRFVRDVQLKDIQTIDSPLVVPTLTPQLVELRDIPPENQTDTEPPSS